MIEYGTAYYTQSNYFLKFDEIKIKNYRSIFKCENYSPEEALEKTYANIDGEVEEE
jgi:hypothetical protein